MYLYRQLKKDSLVFCAGLTICTLLLFECKQR